MTEPQFCFHKKHQVSSTMGASRHRGMETPKVQLHEQLLRDTTAVGGMGGNKVFLRNWMSINDYRVKLSVLALCTVI